MVSSLYRQLKLFLESVLLIKQIAEYLIRYTHSTNIVKKMMHAVNKHEKIYQKLWTPFSQIDKRRLF